MTPELGDILLDLLQLVREGQTAKYSEQEYDRKLKAFEQRIITTVGKGAL